MIKLAIDNESNVAPLPVYNVMDLGAMSRELGELFDEDAFGNVSSVVTLIVTDEGLRIKCSGENPSGYQLMGIFEAAKLQIFADNAFDD
jgi:hypothetical protein